MITGAAIFFVGLVSGWYVYAYSFSVGSNKLVTYFSVAFDTVFPYQKSF